MEILSRIVKVQKAIKGYVDDMEFMGRLVNEFDLLQRRAQVGNLGSVVIKINKLTAAINKKITGALTVVIQGSGGCEIAIAIWGTILRATYLVSGVANIMFDLGFEPQIKSIIKNICIEDTKIKIYPVALLLLSGARKGHRYFFIQRSKFHPILISIWFQYSDYSYCMIASES
ncbi:hypothetical protein L1987_04833 [Smallanthus sonchifolius]|uniref:Uncharacterized protein n=1 Tax=Smallanthus sonchifolius TaxID=185202 RepID=A0ACB9JU04_9ASTR|nr:hypothetical protein L1987_04833 [Smallanthus sonchifolius]